MQTPLLMTVCALLTSAALAAPGTPIAGTGLLYNGPGTATAVTNSDVVRDLLTNAPAGGLAIVPFETVLIMVSNANAGNAKFSPANKADNGTYAFMIDGTPDKLDVDCGQAKGAGLVPYLYIEGRPRKIMFKGMSVVGKIVVNNAGDATGVHIQNISKRTKRTEHARKPGVLYEPGRIHSVITTGKLKRLQSNHGGFGGASAEDPGVIAVGEASPDGQCKANPKGRVSFVLVCRQLAPSNDYDYAGAYRACLASNTVLPRVVMGNLKMLGAKAIGPAVIGATFVKPIPASQIGKRVKLTNPVVGQTNLVQ